MVGMDCPKSSSVPGPDVDDDGPALRASDCPPASTFCAGETSSAISMLASGITTARHRARARMLTIREVGGRWATNPGYPAVPDAASSDGAS